MPWAKNAELPATFSELPDGAKTIARKAANAALSEGASDESAIRIAWGAVKRSYRKTADGWVRKSLRDWVRARVGRLGADEDRLPVRIAVELADPQATPIPDSGLVEGKRIPLVPVGVFHHEKYGRFSVTTEHLRKMIANALATGMDLLLDYDHKTSDGNASRAEKDAAGWIDPKTLSIEGGWLTGVPRWTSEAAKKIASRAWRWISPEFVFDRVNKTTGQRQGATLLAAALTNRPFLPGQGAGVSLSEEGWGFEEPRKTKARRPEKEGMMDERLKMLLGALSLSEGATLDEIKTKLAESTEPGKEIVKALSDAGWDGKSDLPAFLAAIKTPPKGTVVLSETEVSELRANAAAGREAREEQRREKAERLVLSAISEGRIESATKDWWVKQALADHDGTAETIGKMTKKLDLSERGTAHGGEEPNQSVTGVMTEIDKRARARMETEKALSLEDARALVLSEDPELYDRYQTVLVSAAEGGR